MTIPAPDLRVQLAGLTLRNPVMTASGTFGYGREYAQLIDLNRLGAIVVKGLSLKPTPGNPPPRVAETPSGMLNAIGLENVGLDAFLQNKLPFLRTLQTPTVVNIYGETEAEYAELAERLDAVGGIAALEVNISCPNVKAGGVAFGVAPAAAGALVAAVRKRTRLPLMVKLSPNVADVTEIARAVEDAGADMISLINTLAGMAIDVRTRRSRIANQTGGLSGPAIRPVALRMVWQVARAATVPVVGLGGIMTASDALEFLIAGASAIQVGTANFVNPQAPLEIIDGIAAYMAEHGLARLSELVGSLEPQPVSAPDHPTAAGFSQQKETSMNFENVKEVVDFAIEKEQEAHDFYMQASEQESFSGSKQMLREFAEEEMKHKRMLENLDQKGVDKSIHDYRWKWIPDIKRSDYAVEMDYKPGMSYKDMLMLAMKREEKALELYNQLQDMSEEEDAKLLFKMLCQEEAKHKLALETMYDDYMAEMGD
ncbi:MAG: dihydroorotate dehydrogenase [Thermodesulfobacteriota bacterium]